jgi:RND family efflux transporter MFP subunit
MPNVRSRLPQSSWFGLTALAFMAACGEDNRYVAPPPAQVTVATPVQQTVTRYLEATGSTAAVNSGNLVARVEGFVQEIKYRDGDVVKKGDVLFVIEPEPYKLKVDQAQAAQSGAQAELIKSQAEFERQTDLRKRDVNSQYDLDKALAQRDNDKANVDQAKSNTGQAQINYTYTNVVAPYDGVVSARQVSLGDLVGSGTSPTVLATIVQVDPIYVNFYISEQDVVRIRADMARRGETFAQLKGKVPIEVGLQTETGYPHRGLLDYAAPTIDASSGTLQVRGVFENSKNVLLPGNFVRVRVPMREQGSALLVPDAALGSDQGGRYVLVVGGDDVVEQRKVTIGPLVGDLRVVESGLKPDDRVVVDGLVRAIPGHKVAPQTRTASADQGAGKQDKGK